MGNEEYVQEFPLEELKIRATESQDCYDIVDHLRKADIRECWAHGQEPLNALLESYALSRETFTVLFKDKPVLMFGCGEAPTDFPQSVDYKVGWIWLMGTDEVRKFTRRFLRESKRWLGYFGAQYDCLTNMVDIRNTEHIRWLDWMGFTINQAVITHNDHSFYRFVRFC